MMALLQNCQHYATLQSVDHLNSIIISMGKGALLVKADIKEAYRMVPFNPDDQPLLAVEWANRIYIDRALPFGLRSAPKIFSAVADAIQWILQHHGISNLLHYLDDFIFVANNFVEAETYKHILIHTWADLGVPLELSKLEGPSTCLTFLGIEIDTVTMQARLPREKLSSLKQELNSAIDRKSMLKRDLQRLTGLLQFATRVIKPGRPFLRRLYALQDVGHHPTHNVRLNVAARADIVWWHLFIEHWNGISLLWNSRKQFPDTTVFTDASGSWGCGVCWGSHWLQLQWPSRLQDLSITVKELIPVVLAAAIFGPQWSGKVVQFKIDNAAVVQVIEATYAQNAHLMHLLRLLVFYASFYDFWFTASHIPGITNTNADALSRNNMVVFFSQAPGSDKDPIQIPNHLVQLVSLNQTWISTAWMMLFKATILQL